MYNRLSILRNYMNAISESYVRLYYSVLITIKHCNFKINNRYGSKHLFKNGART